MLFSEYFFVCLMANKSDKPDYCLTVQCNNQLKYKSSVTDNYTHVNLTLHYTLSILLKPSIL